MKRFVLLCLCVVLTVSAFSSDAAAAEQIEWLEDGSWIETFIEEVPMRAAGTIIRNKVRTYYSSTGEMEWTIKLTGTFTYDGITAKATNAQVSVTIYNSSNWAVVSKYASTSGAVAKANVTLSRTEFGEVVEKPAYTVTLTCDPDGNVF